MAAVFLAPLYILINAYVVRWMILWTGACSRIFQSFGARAVLIGVYVFFAASLLTGFLIKRPAPLHAFLKKCSNYFLGVFTYILLVMIPADAIRLILKYGFHAKFVESRAVFAAAGAFCVVLVLGVSLYGILHARQIRVTAYEVPIDKSAGGLSSLTIVLLADTHFGFSLGARHARKLAEVINAQKPDLVCIAGDVFDNEYDAIDNPAGVQDALKSIRSRYGTYACWGNHDLNEPILAGFTFHANNKEAASYDDPRMRALLENAGVTLLEDASVLIDGKFYLVGRKDAARSEKADSFAVKSADNTPNPAAACCKAAHRQSPCRTESQPTAADRSDHPFAVTSQKRLTPAQLTEKLDKDKPILFLDHEPKELQETAEAGADLALYGHTHAGQLFPGNLLLSLFWENSCGCQKKGSFCSIVTSGAGVWGPAMRVGTNTEICRITLRFLA